MQEVGFTPRRTASESPVSCFRTYNFVGLAPLSFSKDARMPIVVILGVATEFYAEELRLVVLRHHSSSI